MLLGALALALGWRLTIASMRWTTFQKLLASVAVPIPFGTGLVIVAHTVANFTMQDEDAEYVAPLGVAVFWLGFFLPFIISAVAAAYLTRASLEATQPRS